MNASADPSSPRIQPNYLQREVDTWMAETFDRATIEDRIERAYRYFEESCELTQAAGVDLTDAHTLMTHVWSREPGRVPNEVGDAIVTLAALCGPFEVDLFGTFERTMRRNWRRRRAIRQKNNARSDRGPIATSPTDTAYTGRPSPETLRALPVSVRAYIRRLEANQGAS